MQNLQLSNDHFLSNNVKIWTKMQNSLLKNSWFAFDALNWKTLGRLKNDSWSKGIRGKDYKPAWTCSWVLGNIQNRLIYAYGAKMVWKTSWGYM